MSFTQLFVRFDELTQMARITIMQDDLVFEIQRLYPQIYLGCHVNHVRAKSTKWRISSSDASILSHLNLSEATSPRVLAKHLGVVASTLSASLTRLSKLGYLTNTPGADRRKRELRLTELGREALMTTSVLDATRIKQLLEKLSADEQEVAIRGLSLLAMAASSLKDKK
jgi:MarR family transcriptional regulator, organic hydroperoxide resistance regulator